MSLIFENLILENQYAFCRKVEDIARRFGINPNWLMVVFYIETAAACYGVINHRIQNALRATGLIQFMPRTAAAMGTSPEALQLMSNIEQLDYVAEYFAPYAGRIRSLSDCYLAVLFPAAIGQHDGWVLHSSGLSAETVACWNPMYDLNHDHQITVAEVKSELNEITLGYGL